MQQLLEQIQELTALLETDLDATTTVTQQRLELRLACAIQLLESAKALAPTTKPDTLSTTPAPYRHLRSPGCGCSTAR